VVEDLLTVEEKIIVVMVCVEVKSVIPLIVVEIV
jgi:hypothetical protein